MDGICYHFFSDSALAGYQYRAVHSGHLAEQVHYFFQSQIAANNSVAGFFTQSVIQIADIKGIDFVMITRIVEIGVKDVYVPDYNTILTGYYSDNRNNYDEIHKYQRTVCMKQQHVILRSEIFNSKTGELIWSGISDTIKPDSQLTAQEALLSITSTISGELMMVSSHSS